MNHEFREVRPFTGADELRPLLEGAVLHFGDQDCKAGSRVVLDRDEFAGRKARITWSSNHGQFCARLKEGLRRLDLAQADTEIVVQVRTGYLGLVSGALRLPLHDLGKLKPSATLKADAIASSPSRGARVRVFLVLRRSIERRPLRPWRKGTWLAQAEFTIATKWLGQLFSLKPLDKQSRKNLDLPPNAMRWVSLDGHEPLKSVHAEGYESPDFYVDEDLLRHLNRNTSPGAQALQLQLVQDFVSAVVHAGSSELNKKADAGESPAWEDVKDSLLGRILTQTAQKKDSLGALLDEVRSDPCKVLARYEHKTGLRAKYRTAVTGGAE